MFIKVGDPQEIKTIYKISSDDLNEEVSEKLDNLKKDLEEKTKQDKNV